MLDIGYAAAFLGGLFALVSPCSALLLPAFFAYAFPSGAALLGRTMIFYVGLAGVLVPLGLGVGGAGRLFYGHQTAVTTAAGSLLVGLGVAQILGLGWTVPGVHSVTARLRSGLRGDSAPAVLALGAVSGLAGFCAGPILGAVLTVAATSGSALRGGVLLAVYAAGMTVPLFLLAALWNRYDLGRRRPLRGRVWRAGPFRVHSTGLASGSVFVGLGLIFVVFGGTQGLSALTPPDSWEEALESAAGWAGDRVPDLVLIALAGVAVLAVTVLRLRRPHPDRPGRASG